MIIQDATVGLIQRENLRAKRARVGMPTGVGAQAIILSAGRGSRLLPLTEKIPKALVAIGGRPILAWQLDALAAAGVTRACVVVGFGAETIDDALPKIAPGGMRVHTLCNPFYDVADNLISCWAARAEMSSDFFIVNGDTLFEPAVVERLLNSRPAPITVAVRRKPSYDADDMKVEHDDSVLLRIGKKLPVESASAESIGVMLFRGSGPRLFHDGLEEAVRDPAAKRWWYPSLVDRLAASGQVRVAHVDGLATAEVDFPEDLASAEIVAAQLQLAERSAVAVAK